MKKYLLLLLLSAISYGQATFDEGIDVKNIAGNTAKTINSTNGAGTTTFSVNGNGIATGQNGVSALDLVTKQQLDLKADIATAYTNIVYVNATSPTTATIFDTANPPVTNDNALKTDANNLYIATDNSTWVYKNSPAGYVTYTIPTYSNFFLSGTTTDAGSNKTSAIKRNGIIESTGFISTGTSATNALLAGGGSLANPISGTGTTNYISKWSASGTQTNSRLFDNGTNVGIGTTTPVGSLNILTGTSNTYNLVNQQNGSISFSNALSPAAYPIISGKSNDHTGLAFFSGTNDTNANPDMAFGVRKNDDANFTTLTTSAFRFSRYTTTLIDILRNGNTTFLGSVTTPIVNISSETASTLASFDVSKNVKSLALATYPSLNEISYVKGVTSAVQTQVNEKQATLVSGSNIKTVGGQNILGSGNITEVQNSMTASTILAPSVTAVNTAISLKSDIANPTFTGDPKAPTATDGDNDTSIATTAFVTGAISTADAGNVKLTGSQTISGFKSFDSSTTFPDFRFSSASELATLNRNANSFPIFRNYLGNWSMNSKNSYGIGISTVALTASRLQSVQDQDGTIALTDNPVAIKAIKYNLSTGSNAAAGNATLVAGTVTVTTTACTANSIISLTKKTNGGTVGTITYVPSAGSFIITSSSSTDTSTYSYFIVN